MRSPCPSVLSCNEVVPGADDPCTVERFKPDSRVVGRCFRGSQQHDLRPVAELLLCALDQLGSNPRALVVFPDHQAARYAT